MASPRPAADLYDQNYFQHGCGRPYERTAEWLQFFAGIAEKIVQGIHPRTVLDAGCAMGFLVEGLRERGVEALGIDISEYAMTQVREDLKPYCRIASVLDPLPQRYDLVVCIEVLEHLAKSEAEQAIANLCSATDDILFSSTPTDYREATHFNVQPPEYWAEQFAVHGFVRDVDFDASFITPWAARFRRNHEPLQRVIRNYERQFSHLWRENVELRGQVVEMRSAVQALEEKERTVQTLSGQLTEITSSPTWGLIQTIKRLRLALAPRGSLREQTLDLGLRAWRMQTQAGLGAVLSQAYWTLKRQGRQNVSHPGGARAKDAYQRWIAEHEPKSADLNRQRQTAQSFAYKPLISIITPVYNPSPVVLREAIQSVLAQTYPHWELCLVDGNSESAEVKKLLTELDQQDKRIRIKFLDRNLGISGNSNEALRMAQGEFVGLLDHDDLLAPDILYEVAQALNKNPKADVIYFDEDKISEDGAARRQPWFKPSAWSPDLLLSTNYLMHSVIRRTLLVEVGGFDPQMDGAQDWDLALRCTEKTQNLLHIPRVFYHWRQVKGSASRDANAKPWAFEAQARCIRAHLKRLGVQQAEVAFPSLGCVRILWPRSVAKVSIVIPTKDKVDLLKACLTSIRNLTTHPNYEVLLIDTGSTQPETRRYYAELTTDPRIRLIEYSGPFNFSKVNNLGAQHASGDILLFLNNDTEVLDADWLDELVGWAERPGVGVVGCKLLRPEGAIQHAGIIMGLAGHGSHIFDGSSENHYGPFGSSEWYRDYLAVTGACMAMRRDVFEKLGGFDEAYQVGYSDIEICLRAVDRGYRVVYTPFARLRHHEGGTRGFSLPPNDVLRASLQMQPAIQAGDPFFNPNLSYLHRQPSIAQSGLETREERLQRILKDFGLFEGRETDPFPKLLTDLSAPSVDGSEPGEAESERQRKILMVTHELSLSGAPLILYMLAKYLTEQGYSVTLLSPSDGPLHDLCAEANVEVIVESSALRDARIPAVLASDYGVVLVNTILAWRAVYAARAFQKPCVWWVHESAFGQGLARRNRFVAQAFSAADAVIFPSKATAMLYAEFSPRQNFFPIHTGLDRPPEGQSAPFIKKPDKLYVVTIASLESRKGQDLLLRSIALLPPELQQAFEFYLIGRVLDRRFLKQLTRMAKPLKNVHIVGEVSRPRVAAYLEAADVFALTSRDEALPISLLEAMYYGKAIISTDVGGVAEIVEDGVSGLLVRAEDPRELATSLQRLYENRELMQQLGAKSRSTFEERLTLARFSAQVIRVIEQVMAGHKTSVA